MKAAVIIPTLNEAEHIEGLLEAVCQQIPDVITDIVVTDGGSTDGTVELVSRVSARDPRARLIHNPAKIQSAGINLAVGTLASDVDAFVRLDAHSGYDPNYLSTVLGALRENNAQSVVVRLKTVGHSCLQKSISACMNSVLGTGGSIHRTGGVSQFVDHGHHAGFDRESFVAAGGYDETFVANEDAEFDARLTAGGGRIWFEAAAEVDYFPRSTLGALAKQYFRYGKGRVMTWRKSGNPLRLRQLIPAVLAASIFGSLVLAVVAPVFFAFVVLYLLGCLAGAIWLTIKSKNLCALLAVFALPTIHVSFGTGFILEFVKGALAGR